MRGTDVVLAQQQRALDRMKLSPEERQAKVDEQKKINEAVVSGNLSTLPADVRRVVDNGEVQSLFTSDPEKLMKDVRQPILIVQGELDAQVEPKNADLLERWRRSARTAPPRRREGARRQPSPDAGDHRRRRRVRLAARQACRRGRHAADRHVASEDALDRALAAARTYIASRTERPVWPRTPLAELRAAFDIPLPSDPVDPCVVVDELSRAADRGIVTTTGPRYFGFVIGGALPAALAADWLSTAWDQNGGALRHVAGGGGRRRGRRPVAARRSSGCRGSRASVS